ncbi:testis-expressed protein 44 [Nycticebus coucang]|uniref:testis-expressed protein 44 n=1 Tax=Nycticebus coucang TaxID=9470 RepID=UPI00234C56EF|nr:testis-expressed protein 44 [Nycticebus coucang]
MTTEPSGDNGAASSPTPGSPEASLSNSSPTDSTIGTSQDEVSPPTDVLVSESSPAQVSDSSPDESTGQEDADQASLKTVISMSGDTYQDEIAPGGSQEMPKKMTFLFPRQESVGLQVSTSLPNPAWDRAVEDSRATHSMVALPYHSLSKEKIPQMEGVSNTKPELAPYAPSTEGWVDSESTQSPELQPTVNDTDTSTIDTQDQPDPQATSTTNDAEKKTGSPKALHFDTKILSSDEFQTVTEEDVVNNSGEWQAQSYSPSPEGSVSLLSSPQEVALERTPLDPNLYMASEENNYMRSMTSLLGGGEGSISSLADILVWSETTVGMGMATGFLASGRSTVADILHLPGPSLRSVSSILGSASSAFSSGLASGTGSALRSVTHMLEMVERRTVEGIRSAMRYLTSHLTTRRAHAGPNCD